MYPYLFLTRPAEAREGGPDRRALDSAAGQAGALQPAAGLPNVRGRPGRRGGAGRGLHAADAELRRGRRQHVPLRLLAGLPQVDPEPAELL